jgi:two-component system LytT family response regulator
MTSTTSDGAGIRTWPSRDYHLVRIASAAVAGLFLAYLIVVLLTNNVGLLSAIESSLCNVVPLVLLGLAVRALVRRYCMGRPTAQQVAGHVVIGTAFVFLWYWTLMVLLSLTGGQSVLHFDVRPFFPGPAVGWQLHQGLIFYCLFVALTYLEVTRGAQESTTVAPVQDSPPEDTSAAPARYFIKKGEDIHPIDVRQIISIVGAGDYTEVCMVNERHLANTTLAEFESTLSNDRFIRVHRSRIVNLDRVVRAESAGAGRVLLHMENGDAIRASRSGSKLFRERVI